MHETVTLPAPSAGTRLGERVRSLRVAAGLTQTQLAGTRFSKEYISQIERGKTRPTETTIRWLAEQLRVDPRFLASGVSTEERARVEAQLERAEALSASHSYEDAIAAFGEIASAVQESGSHALLARTLAGEAWALQERGQVREAMERLQRARELVESTEFSDVDRADVLFRLGVCRYKLSSISTAVALFDEAFELAERSGLPCGAAALRHLAVAFALPPPAPRLRRGARRRRACARAGAGPGRPGGDSARELPGIADRPARGPLRALPQLRAARPRSFTSR